MKASRDYSHPNDRRANKIQMIRHDTAEAEMVATKHKNVISEDTEAVSLAVGKQPA